MSAVVRRIDAVPDTPGVPRAARRASAGGAAERGRVFLAAARRRSSPKHQRLPRHCGRRRGARRARGPLPPRDRRARLAPLRVHVRPVRRRRPADPG